MADKKTNIFQELDWALLLFLIGITYVKLYVKIAAILFYLVILIHKKYNTGKLPRLSKFYIVMPVIGIIAPILNGSFDVNGYWLSFAMGALGWVLAAVASYFFYVAVINLSTAKLVATLKAFFLINAIFSLGELGRMIIESGQLVPYWYWEPTEYYGGSTGDHVKGIISNISVTNAAVNALGVIYFAYNKQLKWAVMCLFILLLCTSNLTLILTVITLVVLFLFVRDKKVRLNTVYLLLFIGVIYPILSLNNIKYVEYVYTQESQKKKDIEIKALIPETIKDYTKIYNISQAGKYYFNKDNYFKMPLNDTALISYTDDLKYMQQFGTAKSKSNTNLRLEPYVLQHIIEKWYGVKYENTPLGKDAGLVKLYTFKQTLNYLTRSNKNLLFGAGISNFSSKQAIKSIGLGWQGDFPVKYIYLSNDFLQYHLYSLMFVFSMPISEHSIINMPNSIYNQVAGEYGLLGILAFTFLYVGYIFKNRKKLKSVFYIAPLVLVFFGVEYWFEMISLTAIFELMLFMDIYKNEPA